MDVTKKEMRFWESIDLGFWYKTEAVSKNGEGMSHIDHKIVILFNCAHS